MAVGPIQFSVSTNPIDALNARLLAMGRSEIIVELKSTPALVSGGHYHDITYIARNGGRKAYSIFQGPMDSANDLVSNLIAHINAVELTAKEAHSSHGSLNLSPQRNPIDALNNRLKALGRKEIIKYDESKGWWEIVQGLLPQIVAMERKLNPKAPINAAYDQNSLDNAAQIGDDERVKNTAQKFEELPAISIEILNEHFRLSGIQVTLKSLKNHPRLHGGGYDHRAYYIGRNGEEYAFDWFQGPSEPSEGFGRKFIECLIARGEIAQRNDVTKETASMPGIYDPNAPVTPNPPASLRQRATAEAIEVAYRTAAIKLPDLVRKQLVKRMAAKGGKRPSQARLSLAEDMLSGDEGSLIVAGILSLALSASPEFIKSKMPWLDIDRLAKELRLNVETRIACAVADMLGMYLDGALDALKEAFGGSQLLLAEGGKSDESALFNGVPKAETVRV